MEKVEKFMGFRESIRYSSVGTKFRYKRTLLNFWTKLTQNGFFRTKKKIEIYHRILHIPINLDSKFQFQQTILNFGTNFQKKYTSGQKHTKNEHHYWILHSQISQGTNFHLKLKIAVFWTIFANKDSYF